MTGRQNWRIGRLATDSYSSWQFSPVLSGPAQSIPHYFHLPRLQPTMHTSGWNSDWWNRHHSLRTIHQPRSRISPGNRKIKYSFEFLAFLSRFITWNCTAGLPKLTISMLNIHRLKDDVQDISWLTKGSLKVSEDHSATL